MRAQRVLVATTLLHSGAKFHSFLYTGSKTVRVNTESCYGGMSTRLKQRVVTEFLSAENVTSAEIHRRLQAVYGEDTVNRTTVNRWAINQPADINNGHRQRFLCSTKQSSVHSLDKRQNSTCKYCGTVSGCDMKNLPEFFLNYDSNFLFECHSSFSIHR